MPSKLPSSKLSSLSKSSPYRWLTVPAAQSLACPTLATPITSNTHRSYHRLRSYAPLLTCHQSLQLWQVRQDRKMRPLHPWQELQVAHASTLIVSDPLNGSSIPSSTCSAVTAAKHISDAKESSDSIVLLVVGGSSPPTHVPAGTSKVLFCPSQQPATTETVAAAVVTAVKAAGDGQDTSLILGTSTKYGSSIIPRVAAMLNTTPVTDIVHVQKEDKSITFIRPIYAGNALAKVQRVTSDAVQVLSIRPTSFDKAPLVEANDIVTETISIDPYPHTSFVSENAGSSSQGRPDLGSASVVVSGGRALKDGSNFVTLLEPLVDSLGGGAIGASRAAVDAGMVSNDKQVGQTGKVVAPDLYVAVGISGAIQHISGMKDSKTIVAINKDPDAPIFQVADYGLVSDLFTAVPELTSKLATKS